MTDRNSPKTLTRRVRGLVPFTDGGTDSVPASRRPTQSPEGAPPGGQGSVGCHVLNSSFAHKNGRMMTERAATYGIDLAFCWRTLSDLESDPIHAAELAGKETLVEQTRTDITETLSGCDRTIQLGAAASTGYLIQKLMEIRHTLVRPLDIVPGSHRLEGTRPPAPPEAVLQAVTLPLYDRGTVWLRNGARGSVDYGAVPVRVARLALTLAHHDFTDLIAGHWTAAFARLNIGQRRQGELAGRLNQTLADLEENPWFAPDSIRFFDGAGAPVPESELAGTENIPPMYDDDRRYIAVHPPGHDDIAGYGERDPEKLVADVDDLYMVVLTRLNDQWIKHLQHDAIAWLEAQIKDGANRYANRWTALCERNGIRDDPAEAFDSYRRQYLNEHIPEVN